MIRSTIALAFVLFTPLAFAADINGIEMGKVYTIKVLHEKLGIDIANPNALFPHDTETYSGSLRIANCPTMSKVWVDSESKVTRIQLTFPPECFDDISTEGLLKWGKANVGKNELQNGFGARFTDYTRNWLDGDWLIMLESIDPLRSRETRINMGTLTIQKSRPREATAHL